MNKRIKELAEQAIVEKLSVTEFIKALKLEPHDFYGFRKSELEKFAQLIVRECIDKIENEAAQYAEPVWAFELVNDIKEHFGVEE